MNLLMNRHLLLGDLQFPVFNTINSTYPNYLKRIGTKFDSSEYFSVLIQISTTAGKLLYCSRFEILGTLDISLSNYFTRPFSIDGFVGYFYSTSASNWACYIYRYVNGVFNYVRTSSSCKNYMYSSFFAYKTDETHHYICASSNSSKNTPVVVLLEDGTVNRTEGTYSLFCQYIKQRTSDFVGIYYYSDSVDHYAAIYSTTTTWGAKNYTTPAPLSNRLSIYTNIYVVPQFYNHETLAIRFYGTVDGVANQDHNLIISEDYSSITIGDFGFTNGSVYALYAYGALNVDNHTFYSVNLNTKNIERINL